MPATAPIAPASSADDRRLGGEQRRHLRARHAERLAERHLAAALRRAGGDRAGEDREAGEHREAAEEADAEADALEHGDDLLEHLADGEER